MALKPSLGYEQQLYISTQQYTNLGTYTVASMNSGVLALGSAAVPQLAANPQEMLLVLDTPVQADVPASFVITGLNQNSGVSTWTATLAVPAYATDQTINFPARLGFELIPANATDKLMSVTSVAFSGSALWVNAILRLIGVPSISSYTKVSTKVKIDWDPKVPMPTAVQDGRDRGAYIKGGEIDIGQCDITAKEPTSADGLSRYRGQAVTGLIKEIKEDILPTQNIYLCGLVITPKYGVAEGQEPNTLTGTGMFEKIGTVPAH